METVGCGVGLKVPSGDESGVGSGVVGSGVGSVVGLRVRGSTRTQPVCRPPSCCSHRQNTRAILNLLHCEQD